MNLYLIRHGKTDAFESNIKQSPTTSLGIEGIKQANAAAKRLSKEKINIILSSKWDRAYQTADLISKQLKINLQIVDDIHEKEHNPIIYGIDKNKNIFKKFEEETEKHESNLDWKFEEKGESIRDLINRAVKFKKYLIDNNSDKDNNVLVVSHGLFIKAFIINILLGSSYSDDLFYRIYTSISTSNTGITHFEYDADRDHWELVYFNDHLHIR
jgi:probable phosphoglycerate mutase